MIISCFVLLYVLQYVLQNNYYRRLKMTYLEKYKASLERSQKLIKQFQHEFWEEHSMSKEDFEELVTALGEHIDHAEKMIELCKDEEQNNG